MKKPMFIMVSLLFVLCIIYNYTNMDRVEASTPIQIQEVKDFTGGDTTETTTEAPTKTSSTSQNTSQSVQSTSQNTSQGSSQDSAKDFVSGEGKGESSGKSSIFNQSGDEAAQELMEQSEPDILGDDYQFGDDILQTDETPETFFQHVYKKTWQAFTGVQKIFTVIVLFCFIVAALMTLVSAFGKKERVMWYALTMLLCLIILICIIYAPQIASSFEKWFVTP